MARAIRLMTEVASPKAVKEIRDIDDAITTWENKVKRLEAEYNEKSSETLKVAVVTSMMPPVMQDFIYTNVDDSKVWSWASNKMAMMSGPAPVDVGEVYSSGRRISILQRRSGTRQRSRQWGRALSAFDAAGGGIWPGIAPPLQGSPRVWARILSAGTTMAAKMITDRRFFISTSNTGKNDRDPAKDPRIPGKIP